MSKYSFLLFLALSPFISNAQLEGFQLERSLPQLSNSAFTGMSNQSRLVAGSHFQNVPNVYSYMNNYVGYDQYVKAIRGGLGVEMMQQSVASSFPNSYGGFVMVNYALHLALTKQLNLSLGAGAGMGLDRHFVTELNNGQIETKVVNQMQFRWKTGFVLRAKHLYFGGQFTPYKSYALNNSVYRRDLYKFYVGGELLPFANKNIALNPSVFYTYQNGFQNLDLQLVLSTKRFAVGGSCTVDSQISGIAAVYLNKIEFKYAFVKLLSPLSVGAGTAHELVFLYKFGEHLNPTNTLNELKLF